MACTPSATSTRFGPQTTSTQHSFETNIPTVIVLAAYQTSSLVTSCISTKITNPSSTTSAVSTSPSSSSAWWEAFRGARDAAGKEAAKLASTRTATPTPTATLRKRAFEDDDSCAAWTTRTEYDNAPAETKTTQTNINTWSWDTFETQVPLETLFSPCPESATATVSVAAAPQQSSASSASLPAQSSSAAPARPSSTAAPASATFTPPVEVGTVASSASSSQASSSSSSSSVQALAQQTSASRLTSAKAGEEVTSSLTTSARDGGVGVINNTPIAPETKTLPNGGRESQDSETEGKGNGADAGAVAGGVFGALAGLALLLLAYRWWAQRRRQAKRARNTWYEKSYDTSADHPAPDTAATSRFSTSSQRTTFGAKLNNVRHMAQNSLSGPFPPFFNTVRQSMIGPFGGAGFKATPLHPAGSHPVPEALPVQLEDGPSLPTPPLVVYGGSPPHHLSPLRAAISPPQPFIGDTYAAATADMYDHTGQSSGYQGGYAGAPQVSVQEPSSRGTSFQHNPSIVNSFPLPPEQHNGQQMADDRGVSVYSTPSFYGPHASGQFEYSEYQISGRESLATQDTVDRTTKAWYDKELWDGEGARDGVKSTTGESMYGGIGTSEAGYSSSRPGFAL